MSGSGTAVFSISMILQHYHKSRPTLSRLIAAVAVVSAIVVSVPAHSAGCTSTHCHYLPLTTLRSNTGPVIINGFILTTCNFRPPFGKCAQGDVLNVGDQPLGKMDVKIWFYNEQNLLQRTVTQTTPLPALFPGQSIPFYTGLVQPEYPSATVTLDSWTPIPNTSYRPLTLVSQQSTPIFEGMRVVIHIRNDQPQTLYDVKAIVWAKYGSDWRFGQFAQVAAGQTVSFTSDFPYMGGPAVQVTAIGNLQPP